MKIADITNKIKLQDSKHYFDFTQKWIDFVVSKKSSSDIKKDEWTKFFNSSNPVADINWGRLDDIYKTRSVNERTSIIGKWDEDIRPFIEATINITNPSTKIVKIKELYDLLYNIIIDGGGRKRTVAINRILATFFPDYLINIPNYDNLGEFIDLLNKHIDNGASIVKTNNWIDDCYQVKKFFDNELNDNHLTASAWGFYEYLKKQSIYSSTHHKLSNTTNYEHIPYRNFR